MSMIPKVNVSFGGETVEFMESKIMSDYIKREDAIKALAKAFDVIPMPYALAEGILKDVPSVDAVEVVRCKGCKWYKGCFMLENDDGYCSDGERKDDEQINTFDTSDGNNGDV